ncbi:MAG: potassium/proton antiporter [Cytophagales bacterium]|jgi:cell volume regulation protein A|nr:potassium/proton antiporter [Cytophagales bacterium]
MAYLNVEGMLIIGSLLVFISILTSKYSKSLGIPVLLVFLCISMLAGSDGVGKIPFDDPLPAQVLGSITLCLILFNGGLNTHFSKFVSSFKVGLSLSTLGILITVLILGVLLYLFGIFSFKESLLMGGIVASTDAAAVFSILSSNNLKLKNNLDAVLEFESGTNDPMSYFIISLMILALTSNNPITISYGVFFFFKEMILGATLGCGMGYAMRYLLEKFELEDEFFYPVMILAMTFFTYGVTNYIHGNGFLAVYLAGIIVGQNNFPRKEKLAWFFDSTTWIFQMVMYISLGLLVYPHQLPSIAWKGILTAFILIFIARPLSILASLSFSKYSIKEKLFLSWGGLRGATSIVFATFPLLAKVENADQMFNIVFFVVLISILFQGTTIPFVAKFLEVEKEKPKLEQ